MAMRPIIGVTCICLSIWLSGCSQTSPPNGGPPEAPRRPIARPSGQPDLTSGLDIPPRQRFIFAGGQSEPFTALVTNRGATPVQIVADLDGIATPVVVVEPGGQVGHRFESRQAAIFENPSDQQARLIVEVWGQTQVGMKYRPMLTDASAPIKPQPDAQQ